MSNALEQLYERNTKQIALADIYVKAGAPVGNSNASGSHEFTSREHASQIHELLSDFKKNGQAKPVHLEKLDRAEQYLGIGKYAPTAQVNPEDEEAISRTQGALDSFHRTHINPLMSATPKSKLDKIKHANELAEMKSHHDVASEISQDKSLSPKEREERVKSLLWHGRDTSSGMNGGKRK